MENVGARGKSHRHRKMVHNPIGGTMAKSILTFTLVLGLLALGLGLWSHKVGFYSGLNKGVYVFDCGVEIVGEPGFFCNKG